MHLQEAYVWQFCHTLIVNLDGYNIVLVRCDGKGLLEGMLVDEIAQHKGDATTFEGSCQVFQCKSNVRLLALWLIFQEFSNDVEDMFASFLWRDELLYLVGEEDDAYLVVILNGGEGKCCCNLGHHIAFELLHGTKVETATDIDKQHHRQFSFLLEDFDVGFSEAGCYVPFNVADVVAILVFAHFGEGHTTPFEGGVVFACEDVAAQASGFYLDSPDLF